MPVPTGWRCRHAHPQAGPEPQWPSEPGAPAAPLWLEAAKPHPTVTVGSPRENARRALWQPLGSIRGCWRLLLGRRCYSAPRSSEGSTCPRVAEQGRSPRRGPGHPPRRPGPGRQAAQVEREGSWGDPVNRSGPSADTMGSLTRPRPGGPRQAWPLSVSHTRRRPAPLPREGCSGHHNVPIVGQRRDGRPVTFLSSSLGSPFTATVTTLGTRRARRPPLHENRMRNTPCLKFSKAENKIRPRDRAEGPWGG